MTASWSAPTGVIDPEMARLGRLVRERFADAGRDAWRAGGAWHASEAPPRPGSPSLPQLRQLSWQPAGQDVVQGRVQDKFRFTGEAVLDGARTLRFRGELHRDLRNGALYNFVLA